MEAAGCRLLDGLEVTRYLYDKYDRSDEAEAHPELLPEIPQRKFFEVMHLFMQLLKVDPMSACLVHTC